MQYNIKQYKILGESADVDVAVVSNLEDRVSGIISAYWPEAVFNCNETGLVFRAHPYKNWYSKRPVLKVASTDQIRCPPGKNMVIAAVWFAHSKID